MHDFSTLVELLRYRAQHQPDRTAFIFLQDGEIESDRLTFYQLDRQARAIAAHLQGLGIENERALLLYAPNLAFISAFFGCLYARVVPVPAYPPRANQTLTRLEAIIRNAQAKLALTTAALQPNIERKLSQDADLAQLHCIATDTQDLSLAEQWQTPILTQETLAFLQYTSGSTGTPKGVMVSHGNLLHNSKLIHHCFQDTAESRGVSWLPPYHDMGLIGGVLQPIYVGAQMTLMPPVAFLQRPLRWLQAISQTRATTSGAPNFAYDLCVDAIKPDQCEQLDLSCWQLAFSGAEPVRSATLDRFATAFAACGFQRHAFYPCYGMAETTLIATGGQREQPPVVQAVCEQALALNQVTVPDGEHPTRRWLVGSGHTLPEQQIVIVNPETGHRVSDTEVGEIWVSGPSVAQGYWQQPDKTAQTFRAYLNDPDLPEPERGPFVRTGDLGFLRDGELFVTGRHKDLIIIRGRNHYPQDIEATVEQAHPGLRPGAGAAFSMDHNGEERLVITQEVQRSALRRLDTATVTQAIRTAVVNQHQLQPWRVVLLKTGSIPKTSSGKIRRFACRTGVLTDSLSVVGEWSETAPVATPAQPTEAKTGETKTSDLEAHPSEVPPPATLFSPITAPSALSEAIQEWLVHKIAQLLNVPPSTIDVTAPFVQQGLDSLAAVRLSGELQDWLGQSLSPTLAYDYPSIAALAQYLGQQTQDRDAVHGQRAGQPMSVQSTHPHTDDIAIIGMGCRFPGAQSPAEFWQLLQAGRDAIREDHSRWPNAHAPNWGGFLEQVDQFDAQFFRISPREAEQMDPQQRLLLEVGWEALEDTGLPIERFTHTSTGVFIGISSTDYAQLQHPDLENLSPYTGTGNAHSIAANRLSYLFDLRGPSMTVDTACSSSLVAVHLACQSIRSGDCDQALAGGVNVMLSPVLTRTFAQAGMLSPEGRCKTFDADADGYVRGEGCGVVVLKRLSQAQADGDPILAVVRGSAVNQDGRSNGLTAPNGPAQQAVIRQALAQAQVTPDQISYVDAHGTGTSLGDPIEMQALQAVLMQGRQSDAPCWIGSVKTNIGHLEAAAGIAGLIKVVLALRYGEIPPHLHLKQMNSLIDLTQTPLAVPITGQAWPTAYVRRLAGVSSFGFGGTNAHVVLEAAPSTPTAPLTDVESPPLQLLALSAKTLPALQALAQNYEQCLVANSDLTLTEVCGRTNAGRSRFEHRVAIAASSTEQLRQQLGKLIAQPGAEGRGLSSGVAPPHPAPLAFLFTGQGSQYVEMGWQLYQTQPLFRDVLDRCDQLLRAVLEQPLLEVLYPQLTAETGAQAADPALPSLVQLDQTAYTQPALFALEYALCQLWQAWGIQPAAVMGHSVGEYVAACVAGVFSLEDGLRLIAARARLMQVLPQDGAMVAIFASETQVREQLAVYGDEIAIAAYNGPTHFVVSGARTHMDALVADLTTAGINMRWLRVSHAFHSPLMAPMLDDFRQVADQIAFQPPRLPLISNVTGQLATDNIATADYWCQHILQPVQFAASLTTLQQRGCEIFLEIGPKPILAGMGQRCVTAGTWLSSLKPPAADWEPLLHSLGQLYVQGYQPHWSKITPQQPRRYFPLPTYPWQRQRYWFPGPSKQPVVAPVAQPLAPDNAGLYQIGWQPQALSHDSQAAPPGLWVLLMDAGNLGAQLQDALVQHQQHCWCVSWGEHFHLSEPDNAVTRCQLNPTQPEHWAQLWTALSKTHALPWRGIVSLAALSTGSAVPSTGLTTWGTRPQDHCQTLLLLLQGLLNGPQIQQPSPPRIWVVTRGATDCSSPHTASVPMALDQAPLWGLGKVIALEHSERWGGLIDLETAPSAETAHQLWSEIQHGGPERQVAWREGQRYVARLQAVEQVNVKGSTPCCQSDGTYLITGGLGALGLQVVQWLVTQGARSLLLVGRRPPSSAAQAALDALQHQGVTVTTVAMDVCDRTQLPQLQTALQAAPTPLRGVIHAAGVIQDGRLHQQTWEQFAQVMAPKVAGAWHVHCLTQDQPLDFFILFSSAAALLGSPGQGNYAAANAFMDALAHWRRQHNLPALSINWGPWADVGMAAQLATPQQQALTATGINLLPIAQGLQSLEACIRHGQHLPAQTGVLSVHWETVSRYVPSDHLTFLTQVLAAQPPNIAERQGDTPTHGVAASPLFQTLTALESQARIQHLIQYLQGQLADILHLDVDALDIDANLIEAEMDSLAVMDTITQLQRDLDLMLYPREFYERPRIRALATYLAAEFERSHGLASSTRSPQSADPTEAAPTVTDSLLFNFAAPSAPPPTTAPPQDRLPGIVFILSSPRSGSTLLRVMLGGHPHLVSTPELHLLPFETMAERAKNLALSHLGEGLQRVFMDLKGMGVKASQTLVQDLVNRGLSIKQVYAMLQEAAGSRLLVDKSPTYAMSMNTLGRAEQLFTDAKYIHLVRHPYAMIESFVRMRMDKLLGAGDDNPYQLAESIWTHSNQNVLQFCQPLGHERHYLVRYEDLVMEPTKVMEQVCAFLGIGFHPSVLQPYEGERMTDGVHTNSLSLGDPNFLKHRGVEKALGDAWKRIKLPHQLGKFARTLTAQLGYELPHESPTVAVAAPMPVQETTQTVRDLDLCLCHWGPISGPLVVCLHGILDQGTVWEPIAQQLAAHGYHVVAPDLRGHGRSAHARDRNAYQLLDYLADLEQLIPALTEQPIHLVGHSMGSVIAALYASLHAQQVRQLVLIETVLPADQPDGQDPLARLKTQLDYMATPPQHPILPDVTAATNRLLRANPNLSESLARRLAERATQPCAEGLQWRWDPVLRTRAGVSFQGAPLSRADYLHVLSRLVVPVTLMYGDRSQFNRAADLAAQQVALPAAQRYTFSGGHNIHLDAATAVGQQLLPLLTLPAVEESQP